VPIPGLVDASDIAEPCAGVVDLAGRERLEELENAAVSAPG
jgi:hypothetical protein